MDGYCFQRRAANYCVCYLSFAPGIMHIHTKTELIVLLQEPRGIFIARTLTFVSTRTDIAAKEKKKNMLIIYPGPSVFRRISLCDSGFLILALISLE